MARSQAMASPARKGNKEPSSVVSFGNTQQKTFLTKCLDTAKVVITAVEAGVTAGKSYVGMAKYLDKNLKFNWSLVAFNSTFQKNVDEGKLHKDITEIQFNSLKSSHKTFITTLEASLSKEVVKSLSPWQMVQNNSAYSTGMKKTADAKERAIKLVKDKKVTAKQVQAAPRKTGTNQAKAIPLGKALKRIGKINTLAETKQLGTALNKVLDRVATQIDRNVKAKKSSQLQLNGFNDFTEIVKAAFETLPDIAKQ